MQILMKRALESFAGFQSNCCGAELVELAGNLPYKGRGRTVHKEVSNWRYSVIKLCKEGGILEKLLALGCC